jgi:hypothetical protein
MRNDAKSSQRAAEEIFFFLALFTALRILNDPIESYADHHTLTLLDAMEPRVDGRSPRDVGKVWKSRTLRAVPKAKGVGMHFSMHCSRSKES